MQNILAGFLAANLLPIGEDDEKLKLLESAAEELAKEISDDNILCYRCALVALDETVLANDPIHKKVGEAIAQKWKTMINKTGTSPIQVHRAVLLRAIQVSSEGIPDLRFAMGLIASNLPSGTIGNNAKQSVEEMLAVWEQIVRDEVTASWANTVDMSLPKLTGKVKKIAISKDDLTAGLGRASGPSDKDSKAYPNPNPHWPNSGNPWSYEFAPRAAEAVITAIQNGMKGYTEDIQEALRETVLGWSQSLEQLAIRDAKTELLWIKASLYSPSAQKGYKALDKTELVFHSMLDVNRAVSKLAPRSVEFFLRDLVSSLSSDTVSVSETIKQIGPKLKMLTEGEEIYNDETLPAQGRRSLLDCAVRGFGPDSFRDQTGFPEDSVLSVSEFAVHLYRELQIRKLLS